MSILNWFNKPKWQSPNEQVRIAAIQTSEDPELIKTLIDIVNNDQSSKVQKAALARVTDPEHLINILHQHQDKTIKNQARKKLNQWFAETGGNNNQIELVQKIADSESLKNLAELAQDKAVRKYAIQHIKQQGFLGELLFKESAVELQQLIVDKIEEPKKLRALLKKTKKSSDLHQLINAKLGNETTSNQNDLAIELCRQLEQVVLGKAQDVKLADISEQWQQIENTVTSPIKLRYNGAFEAAKMILDPEHRAQFLQQQKSQRAATQLHELEQLVIKTNQLTLKQTQEAINKYQNLSASDFNTAENNRFKAALKQLIQRREEIQKEQQIPEAVTTLIDDLNQQLNKQVVQPDSLKQFKNKWNRHTKNVKASEALTLIKKQFDQNCLKLAEKIEQSAQIRQEAATQAVALIEPTIAQIKEGHLTQSKEMSNQIAELKKTAGYNHPIITKNKYQLDQVWQQLKDLRKWQKWSNDKARQDIIDEVHAMIGKAQHPDAVLKKLKEANERWYALEDMEKLPGDKYPSRNHKMWQEFRVVSKALFEPTQPFFEKRSEQQDGYLGEIETHIKNMQQTDLEQTSERDLARLSRDAIKFLKSLDKLPPKKRGVTAKKLRQAIDRIDQKLNEFYSVAENKKLKLIDQAKALVDVEDQREAIETAKALQQQWKTAGIVKQHTERKLWKKFRKANDAIFKRREQEQQAKQAAQQEQRQEVQTLIKQFKTELKKTDKIKSLNNLKSDFNQQRSTFPENLLKPEQQQLIQSIDEKISQLKTSNAIKAHQAKQNLDQLFTDFESGKIDEKQKNAATESLLSEELVAFFEPRFNPDQLHSNIADLLIQAEFITGLETPAEFMEARMAYQVKVLSERMSGEKTSSDNEQAEQWLTEWYLTPKTDAEFMQKSKKRISKTLKAMLNQLG